MTSLACFVSALSVSDASPCSCSSLGLGFGDISICRGEIFSVQAGVILWPRASHLPKMGSSIWEMGSFKS